jgi:hypothetical protein
MRALQELTINRRMRALFCGGAARAGPLRLAVHEGAATVDPDLEGVLPSHSSSDPEAKEAKVGRLR